ncbi:MAG TPA: ATP-binding protein [Polyangiales bacterium]|nr:ATP-binding protein [Polyangiales bacterium]
MRQERDLTSQAGSTDESAVGAASWHGLAVLDLMQEGLQVIAFDWRYLYVNRAAAEHGRRSKQALIGRTMHEVYPGIQDTPLYAVLQRCMHERAAECFENEFGFGEGRRGWFEVRIEPVPEGLLVLSIDATMRRELERNLSLSQKMDALGRLAGGVAHDFNNILTVIMQSTEFVAGSLAHDDPNQDDLHAILNVTERGARMVRQLLAFSRGEPRNAHALDVNAALSDLLPILRRMVSEAVTLEFTPDPAQPAIRMDPGQLSQVILNLVANARDAISLCGTIHISCATIEPDVARGLFRIDKPEPPEYVRIAVSDDGCGMDQTTLALIFEPFFTTKEKGKGTGLGLAAAHGVVKQNDGEIKVVSASEHGTTVELYFPRVAGAIEARRIEAEAGGVRGGDEVVLVVDDEAAIRGLCARALRSLGYSVLQAESPSEALQFVAEYAGRLDLVLSDVSMPEMSGVLLCRQLIAVRPTLRTLLMSGYVDSASHPGIESADVLAKPFTQAELARRIRDVLES